MLTKHGISESLVNFLYNLNYDNLSQEVVAQVKRCLLDYLGVTLAGSTTGTAMKLRTFLSKFKDKANKGILSSPSKLPSFV